MTPHASPPDAPPIISAERMRAWRSFLEAHARVVDALARELKEVEDLPLPWYDVLVQLHEAPQRRLRMQELAEAVVLSKTGLTRLVDRMERAGLVVREPCPDDRRGTYAELTDAGYERLRQTAPTHLRGIDAHFTSLIDAAEAETLARVLERITAAVES
jgi:DNA-binding MarR family transcriptional regulator